jgi:hypothetical protein
MEYATAAAGARSGARGPRRGGSARTTKGSTLISAALLVTGGCVADAGFPVEERRGAGVVGGQAEGGYPAVGYLLVGGQRSCGVTVIGPRAAVTASHCVVGGASFGMGFGDGGNEHAARTTIMHPQYDPNGAPRYLHDVAVLLFDQDLGVGAATITTADPRQAGRYIGYGRTTPGEVDVAEGYTNERKSAGQSIDRVDGLSVWTTGLDGGLCWGDSGGPLMIDGTSQILGVLADFDGVFDCQVGNRMIFTSLAGEQDFIDRAVGGELGGIGEGGGDDGPGDGGGQGGACEYDCATYGYSAGQCNEGWTCDGSCITYTGCGGNGGGGGGGNGGGGDWGGQCTYSCADYGYIANQCNQGWFCDGVCIEYTGCEMGGGGGGAGACEYRCEDFGYATGQCYEGWYCDGLCLSYAGCGYADAGGYDDDGGATCTYSCDEYGYFAGECCEGWFCDGACLSPADC